MLLTLFAAVLASVWLALVFAAFRPQRSRRYRRRNQERSPNP